MCFRTFVVVIFCSNFIAILLAEETEKNVQLNTSAQSESSHHDIHIVTLRWNFVHFPFIITLCILAISLLKIVFHHIKPVAEHVPESCLLIALGLLIGVVFLYAHGPETRDLITVLRFNTDTFFLYLLPPLVVVWSFSIILEAAYSLRDRAFVENVGAILLYAVVGTILNIILIGVLLYAFKVIGAMGSLTLPFLDCLIFSSLIAAVDPVAVLAIFQEVGVNDMLYYMVFGESLFNDAVTVVVYNLIVKFKQMDHVTGHMIGKGLAAFLAVSFGAMFIGFICGILTACITKYTAKIRVVEPSIMFGMAYFAYLFAEFFHFSGIISIISCGLIQAHYAAENISSKSYITVHYVSKVASSITESIIFIILGVMLLIDQEIWYDWNWGFSLIGLLLCLLVRFFVVFLLTYCVNLYTVGIRRITHEEQLIMSYGGLRGAISFSLVFMLNQEAVKTKNTLMTATFLVILFTVIIQGTTIKPLVHLLRIQLRSHDISMTKEITRGIVENVMTGMESIIGYRGSHYWTGMVRYVSHNFLRPAVQKHAHRKGKGLLVTQTELAMKQKTLGHQQSVDSGLEGNALWKQLEDIDQSELPASFGDIMLEGNDVVKEKSTRKPSEKFDKKSDVFFLRDLLMTPLQKTIHYESADKTLTSAGQRFQQLQRQALIKDRVRRKATIGAMKPNLLRTGLIPLMATANLAASNLTIETSFGEDDSPSVIVERY